MELHPNLKPVAGLIGTWRGPGTGEYPTISSFTYTEELTFTNVGKPFLTYLQRTTGFGMELRSQIMNSATAKHVEETARKYSLADDQLSVDFAMAAVGLPMTHHLSSTLRHADPAA